MTHRDEKPASGEEIFAHDVNLGFPLDHPDWANFFNGHGWRTAGYDDMGKLTAELQAHAAAAAFLPAANYFFVRNDPAYQPGDEVAVDQRVSGWMTVTSMAGAPSMTAKIAMANAASV